jgi:CHASE3 domain sensor protein
LLIVQDLSGMKQQLDQRIERLSRLITEEQDRQKLLRLAEEVNKLLKEKRLNQKTGHAA